MSLPTPSSTRHRPVRPASPALPHWQRVAKLTINMVAVGTMVYLGSAQAQVDPAPVPEGLKGVAVPTPSTLSSYILDKSAAIRLGKALFWDMQVGSDGKTACASCHFHAGADNRSKNQISPGLNRMASPTKANPDTSFQLAGPNYQLKLDDFPTHKFADPNNRDSQVLRSTNDVVSSQGVFNEKFVGVTPGASTDQRQVVYDPVFHVGASNTRRVEPRNTPTVINAVFNFRNFWDGRAQYLFNGVNPFGARDANARVYKTVGSTLTPVQVRIDNASLASQASGPPGSPFEMSADGRTFMDLGKRLLRAKPLAQQKVSSTDSVLGLHANPLGNGLTTADYGAMVKAAFKPEWWNANQAIQIDAAGNRKVIPVPANLAANQYYQMHANFSLIFSLAVQLYESTLVSSDSPFDRHMAGLGGMTPSQSAGMGVFFGKGKCANCHGGAEFTNASVRKTLKEPLARMVMGNGATAVYDEGFYNTAVTPTLDDIHNGANDPFGKPLSLTGLAQQVGSTQFKALIGITPNLSVAAGERIAVNGASKTSTVRNIELTAPYFSNGSVATLREVVDFYNRGGNFARNNRADLDADIQPLGLTETEKAQLIDFMVALTDDRVRYHAAPFDHPQLFVPNGHDGNTQSVASDGEGRAKDLMLEVAAVGASGYKDKPELTPANFLGTALSGSPTVSVVSRQDGRCLDVGGGSTSSGAALIFYPCHGRDNQKFKMVPAGNGAFWLKAAHSGKVMRVRGASSSDGAVLEQGTQVSGVKEQAWMVLDAGNGYYTLYSRHANKCLNHSGDAALQWSCQSSSAAQGSQQFLLK